MRKRKTSSKKERQKEEGVEVGTWSCKVMDYHVARVKFAPVAPKSYLWEYIIYL